MSASANRRPESVPGRCLLRPSWTQLQSTVVIHISVIQEPLITVVLVTTSYHVLSLSYTLLNIKS